MSANRRRQIDEYVQLFELHVRMQVNLRRFRRFVTEPECDHAEIPPSAEQCHGRSVAQRVGLHAFHRQRGTRAPCRGDMSEDEPLDRIGAETPTACTREEGIRRFSTVC